MMKAKDIFVNICRPILIPISYLETLGSFGCSINSHTWLIPGMGQIDTTSEYVRWQLFSSNIKLKKGIFYEKERYKRNGPQ